MISGTDVNEICDSLPNGDIVRLIGNGWKPRSRSLEIIQGNGKIIITDYRAIQVLSEKIAAFLKEENSGKYNKDHD
jgi:hypothetical protein